VICKTTTKECDDYDNDDDEYEYEYE